jgi:hypothetical protein
MSQSALTVTPENPSPPTNFGSTGVFGPNPPNFTVATYGDPHNWGTGPFANPPPYYDKGSAGSLVVFAAPVAALAGGTGATAGGTPGTYPGTGTGTTVNNVGLTPASTSVAHEGAGTEVVVTAAVPNPSPAGQLQTFSCLGSVTNVANPPNAQHASSLSAAITPTITGLSAGGAHGPGTTLLTVTGTNFNRASIVNVSGIPQTTQYVNATTLTVTNAPKNPIAGNLPVTVTAGVGGVTTAATNWVFT